MTGTAVYWLLFALAALIAYTVYVGIKRETARAARLAQLQAARATRRAEDHYWANHRLDAFVAAILVTAHDHPERLEELMAS